MLSTRITEDIRKAIEKYYHSSGLSLEELSERLGVNKSTLHGWLTGNSERIRCSNWHRLYPEIQQYLSVPDTSYTPSSEIDNFRYRLFNAALSLDIEDTAKIKILKLIKETR